MTDPVARHQLITPLHRAEIVKVGEFLYMDDPKNGGLMVVGLKDWSWSFDISRCPQSVRDKPNLGWSLVDLIEVTERPEEFLK